MFRLIAAGVRIVGVNTGRISTRSPAVPLQTSLSCYGLSHWSASRVAAPPLLQCDMVQRFCPVTIQPQCRTVTKFSLQKGKRKAVKTVLKRFYRLNWGAWIRTRAGKNKRVWKKSSKAKRLSKEHVFCNSTQSWLLDKMVTSYWRKPKYYVDDPYEPYHTREEFHITRRKPVIPE
ncbi:large ribosomal subunit protein bL35m [Anabrus simplex]|uniref:large ribosomal subunit protein bL35m n=1 Tax=Anabrus simplex TaxID=316456 RepID=UPI0035A2C209